MRKGRIYKWKNLEYKKIGWNRYQVTKNFIYSTGFKFTKKTKHGFIYLGKDGILKIRSGYIWDGPSGPTINTKNSMRASLVHDAFYDLFRSGKLTRRLRKKIDELFYRMLRSDNMNRFRAWLWYVAVRAFGGRSSCREIRKG